MTEHMTEVTKTVGTLDLNSEGYLVNPTQWTIEIAQQFAQEEGIELTEKHLDVIRYLREQYENDARLSIRRIGKSGIVTIKEFYGLFPGGPLKKASRIAGIPKPASCV